jgi:hypothetical protein
MKNLTVFGLVLAGIVGILYIGANGLTQQYSWGPFLLFVGACATVGFSIDIFNHFRPKRTR